MATTDVQAAIELLIDSASEAIEQIDQQISDLSAKLARLKRARKVLAKANGEHKAAKRRVVNGSAEKSQHKLQYWQEIEGKIFDAVSTAEDKVTCGDIAEMLGLSYTTIGKAVLQSSRLEKQGSYVVIS